MTQQKCTECNFRLADRKSTFGNRRLCRDCDERLAARVMRDSYRYTRDDHLIVDAKVVLVRLSDLSKSKQPKRGEKRRKFKNPEAQDAA